MRHRHRRAHLGIWLGLALLLPQLLVAAAALRLGAPPAEAPVRLSAPEPVAR